jgi:high-affinity iron transporter
MRTILTIASALLSAGAWAHGGGGGDTIDDHHAALRDALQAQLGEAYDAPVDLDNADLDDGEALYGMHCASCHGATGLGDGPAAASLDPPPSDLTDGVQMGFISDAGFLEVLRAGLPETGMPGYGDQLDEAARLNVYAWTKTLRRFPPPTQEEEGCTARPAGKSDPTAWLMLLGAWGLLRRKTR